MHCPRLPRTAATKASAAVTETVIKQHTRFKVKHLAVDLSPESVDDKNTAYIKPANFL